MRLAHAAAALAAALAIVATAAAAAAPAARTIHALRAADGSFDVRAGAAPSQALGGGQVPCAEASFRDTVARDGWSYLNVTTPDAAASGCSDADQAYAAGLLEAHLTAVGMYQTVVNGNLNATLPKGMADFFQRNQAWEKAQLARAREGEAGAAAAAPGGAAYWHQLNLTRLQLQGLLDGYRRAAPREHQSVTDTALALLTWGSDLETLQSFMPGADGSSLGSSPFGSGEADPGPGRIGFGRGGHCSGLVKLLDGNAELFTSHDTWSSFNSMLRVYKRYAFGFTTDGAPGSPRVPVSTFSSYPGALFSGDDFYQMSSGLAVLETTIGNSNPKLWQYVTPEAVLVWQRNVIANRLATDGRSWCETFAYLQNGCYNNEYLVVDYNRFTPGSAPLDGTLYVLDQLPGRVQFDDLTGLLRRQGYFPSYNSPYFRDIFVAGGFAEQQAKYGAWFSYNDTARANIFRRDHGKVTDLASMKRIMRYNDFEHDPLSRCDCTPPYSAENAVAARDDLNPANGTYAFGALGHRNHAATDSKIASAALMGTLSTAAISSPTYDQQPAFRFSTSPYADVPHLGLPDEWKFPWVTVEW